MISVPDEQSCVPDEQSFFILIVPMLGLIFLPSFESLLYSVSQNRKFLIEKAGGITLRTLGRCGDTRTFSER